MTDYSRLGVGDLLDAFASSEPLPGGGSAAALTAAIGVSLLLMVARMPRTRTGSSEDAATLTAIAERLLDIRQELTALVDADSRAYQDVIAAYRQARATEAEKVQRVESIQRALRGATEVPLQTMRLCERALIESRAVVSLGNPNAATDAVVGTRLLTAALEGAGLNVDVNVAGVKDQDFVRRTLEERRTLERSARELSHAPQ